MEKGKKACGSAAIERIPAGIDGLDNLIEGGFVKNSTIMVRGGTGTGKTIFCLQYLYKGAVDHSEPGVYISFSESEETIYQHGISFCWDIEALVKKNMFVVARYEPHEMVSMVAEGGGSLRDIVESTGAKRIAIDSLTAYRMVFENEYKANESVLELLEMLRKWDVTAVVTSEFPVTPDSEDGGKLGFLTDGLINLYHLREDAHRLRTLEIIKMRDTNHSQSTNLFTIGKDGLKVVKELKHFGRK